MGQNKLHLWIVGLIFSGFSTSSFADERKWEVWSGYPDSQTFAYNNLGIVSIPITMPQSDITRTDIQVWTPIDSTGP